MKSEICNCDRPALRDLLLEDGNNRAAASKHITKLDHTEGPL